MKTISKLRYALLAPVLALLLFWAWGADDAMAAPQSQPQVNPIQLQSASSVTNFRATASRVRGRIDLSWYYTGRSFTGYFVVERSTNGSTWRSVSACTLKYNGNAKTPYTCMDTGLASGTSYSYRACILTKGTACSSASATKAVTVKAP